MGFRNNVPSSSPAKVNNSGDDDMDVAAKMEDAYGNLNKMLGDGAMASMANETKKLVAQQQELMNTLSTMTPSLNKAKETLENLNLPNMEEMTGILKNSHNNFNGYNIYMAKRCPPGVICIENITIIFLILVLCLAGIVWYKFGNSNTDTKATQHYINVLNPTIPKFNTVFST